MQHCLRRAHVISGRCIFVRKVRCLRLVTNVLYQDAARSVRPSNGNTTEICWIFFGPHLHLYKRLDVNKFQCLYTFFVRWSYDRSKALSSLASNPLYLLLQWRCIKCESTFAYTFAFYNYLLSHFRIFALSHFIPARKMRMWMRINIRILPTHAPCLTVMFEPLIFRGIIC